MQNRIEVIDALRAVTLLGILLTHTAQFFCFSNPYNEQIYLNMESNMLVHYLLLLFSGKCRIIFCILFGLSFYFLLRNPLYSNKKYFWRCILLIAFGLLNKLFYTTEILMWYGICGVLILPFRHLRAKRILLLSAILYLCFLIFRTVNFDYLFPDRDLYTRYMMNQSLIDIISYPIQSSILDYLSIVIPKGLLETISYFLFGYYIGKSEIILSLERYISTKLVIISFVLFIVSTFLYHQSFGLVLYSVNSLIGALTYSICFIYLYIKLKVHFSALERYGKMGLSNYTFQNVCGVIFCVLIFIPYGFSFDSVLICMLVFYSIQMILSFVWLKYNKYGPLEGLWRSITNLVN